MPVKGLCASSQGAALQGQVTFVQMGIFFKHENARILGYSSKKEEVSYSRLPSILVHSIFFMLERRGVFESQSSYASLAGAQAGSSSSASRS